ncbi:DUF475 domain-containing protein [Lactococcus petauri]|uniref:DUF475 domain-containing protein n=1 Tax=Lactococcus petauri TaxID=1940789 RepID=A0A252CF72_9LACT|nr:DUF475 domain-containing protein [Lactococcus petauri]OUK05192.1 hypothetical protein BZZ03_00285 [Lactococcus petauri]
MKHFRGSILITVVALIVAFLYGGLNAFILAAILGIMEVSLSFDNAIVNARILERMSHKWRNLFLTLGMLIAVLGMRFFFPLVVVSISAQMSPAEALKLAFAKGNPEVPGTYGYILAHAHPMIAAFGGMFLLMLALNFFFDSEKDFHWFILPESVLSKVGNFPAATPLISMLVLMVLDHFIAKDSFTVMFAGVAGMALYLAVEGLGAIMENHGALAETAAEVEDDFEHSSGPHQVPLVAGKAALGLFLYLEMVDASFSFDGAIGAFAITPDPIIIMLGLGLIGAMFVRSLTIFLVEKGTLNDLVYLDHGAHWAILILSILLLLSAQIEIPEVVTGLIGAIIICASLISSLIYNKKHKV